MSARDLGDALVVSGRVLSFQELQKSLKTVAVALRGALGRPPLHVLLSGTCVLQHKSCGIAGGCTLLLSMTIENRFAPAGRENTSRALRAALRAGRVGDEGGRGSPQKPAPGFVCVVGLSSSRQSVLAATPSAHAHAVSREAASC